jgi:hypothetical protein
MSEEAPTDYYDFLPRCGTSVIHQIKRYGKIMKVIASASTTDELAAALEEERLARGELLLFVGAFDVLTRVYDPYIHFASTEQELLTNQLITERADAALSKSQTNTQEPDSAA